MFIRSLSVLGAAAVMLAAYSADAFGKGYRGGKYKVCYRKVVIPPVYRTITEQVMVAPASCAQYRTPPAYGVTAREVVVQPATQVVHSKRAVYGSVQETRMVRPARTRWTRQRCDGAEYRCAVTTPAKYRTRTKRVLIAPRSTWVETRPAVMGVVQQRVMLHPGSVRQVCQPALYQTVTRQVMVRPASVQWVPAAYPGQAPVYRRTPYSSAPAYGGQAPVYRRTPYSSSLAYGPTRYSGAPRRAYRAPLK